jgi:hypothetical protein
MVGPRVERATKGSVNPTSVDSSNNRARLADLMDCIEPLMHSGSKRAVHSLPNASRKQLPLALSIA